MHGDASFTSWAATFFPFARWAVERKQPTPVLTAVVASLCVVMLLGCGKNSSHERAAVCGKVLLDGKNVSEGVIAFYPTGASKGPAAGASIKDGHYKISEQNGPVVGTNRVEIRIPKRTGRKTRVPLPGSEEMIDQILEAAPDCYNTHSTLTANIEIKGNVFDFSLHSK